VNVADGVARGGGGWRGQSHLGHDRTILAHKAEDKHLIRRKIATVSYVHLSGPIPKLVRDVVNYGAVPSTPDESEAEKGQCRIAAKESTHKAEFRRSIAVRQG
jgi:hypothetical protein